MKQALSIPHYLAVGRKRVPYRELALAALFALIIGALGLAVETGINFAAAAPSSETAAVEPLPTYPTRVLPKEWRGYRKSVEYEHMYRKNESRRLDWIRSGGGG